jgi:hypothetical protein
MWKGAGAATEFFVWIFGRVRTDRREFPKRTHFSRKWLSIVQVAGAVLGWRQRRAAIGGDLFPSWQEGSHGQRVADDLEGRGRVLGWDALV